MSATEYRGEAALGCEIRAVHEGDRTLELRVVNYGVADSYGSVWEPGVFRASLETKRPSACWSHDWARIIGSLKEHDERADGLDGLVQLADFDAVPDAKMAWSLLKDKHLTNTSFGFKRQAGGWSDTRAASDKLPGERERMRAARLDEVSPVLVGSVPGAGVLNVRSEALGGQIAIADASQLIVALSSGQVTLRDALEQLEGRAAVKPNAPHAFAAPDGDGADCEVCGKDEDAKIHGGKREEESGVPEGVVAADLEARTVEDVWDMMRADGLASRSQMIELRAQNHSASLERLISYWAHGKGAPKIGWGTSGDFNRCRAELGKYVPPNELAGFCARLHKVATGASPGHAPGEKASRADGGREPETESSPTT